MVQQPTERERQATERRRIAPLVGVARRPSLLREGIRAGAFRPGRPAFVLLALACGLTLAVLVVGPATLAAQDDATAAYTPREEANLAVARRFFEDLHDEGDLAVAGEIVAADAVFHIPGGELTGPEGIGGLVTLLRAAFPDAAFPIEDVAVDGDTVAVRWTMRGSSKGEFQGIPPTGEAVTLPGTAFLHIQDGRIVEDWVTYDQLGLLQQLGAAPGAATPTG